MLALAPAETRRETALFAVPGIESAIGLMTRFRQSSAGFVSAFEYISGTTLIAAINDVPDQTCPLQPVPNHAILVEAGVPSVLPEGFSLLEAVLEPVLEDGLIEGAVLTSNEGQRNALWLLRENVVEGLRIEGGNVARDVTIPTSITAGFLQTSGAALEQAFPGCRLALFGHLGDGSLHCNIQFPKDSDPAASTRPGNGSTRSSTITPARTAADSAPNTASGN